MNSDIYYIKKKNHNIYSIVTNMIALHFYRGIYISFVQKKGLLKNEEKMHGNKNIKMELLKDNIKEKLLFKKVSILLQIQEILLGDINDSKNTE